MVRTLVGVMGLLASVLATQAQSGRNHRLDSLEIVLRQHPAPDTGRVQVLNELVWEHRASSPARSIALAAEALRLGQQLSFKRGQAKTYALLGIVYSYAGRYDSGQVAFRRAIRLRRQLGDSAGVAGMISNLGEAYMAQGYYESAVREYLHGIALQERYGQPDDAAADLANLGLVLLAMGRQRQALVYFRRYLLVRKRSYYPPNEAEIRRNFALAYLALHQPDSARVYAQAALRLSQGCNDQRGSGIAQTLLAQVALLQPNPAPGLAYARQAQAIAQALAEKPEALQALLVAGQLETRLGQSAAALASLLAAQRLATEVGDLASHQKAAQALAQVEKQAGHYAQALQWQERAAQLADSLLTTATTRQVAEMQTKYDTEKKEAQNRLQAAQLRTQQQVIRRRNTQLVAGLAVAGLLAGLAYLLYTRRRLRREVEFAQERQQLERLRSQAVLEAEENERRRIGSDLHDGVGQLLTAARLNLETLGEQLGPQPEDRQTLLTNAHSMLDESFREVRSISHNLMPNALIKLGLARAVRDFLQKTSPDNRLKINLEVVGLDGTHLAPTLENVLFRVVQEAVQNIVKHARASEISLQIIRHETELTVVIEDNGVGFDPAALGPNAGIGLQNIESRMAYLGGRADFDSSPGRGTTVTLEVPV
ncbi:MAG: tetratricopeptide repeat-containing sensor histidine kinase [Janthinobacterium lividum]